MLLIHIEYKVAVFVTKNYVRVPEKRRLVSMDEFSPQKMLSEV